jgi:LAO/AO transport system kinase
VETELTRKIINGDVRAAARLMRGLEDDSREALEEMRNIYAHTGKAHIIGVTGPPGVGKSTILDAMIKDFRRRKASVGVVAVDPTSPFTGGALLGDRIRMASHTLDQGVFIRSLASRGQTGGLARAVFSIVHVLDAMGKNIILVEAVGSGQGEVDIARLSDTTIVVLSPGAGDEIQMMKAGILETADIFVINKADKEGAKTLKVQMEQTLGIATGKGDGWQSPIILTTAIDGAGVKELVELVLKHKQYLLSTGKIEQRRRERARFELVEMVEQSLRSKINEISTDSGFKRITNALANKKMDPYTAAESIIDKLLAQYQ